VTVVKYILLKICAFLFFRVVKQVTRGEHVFEGTPRVGVARSCRPGAAGQELEARSCGPGAGGQELQARSWRPGVKVSINL